MTDLAYVLFSLNIAPSQMNVIPIAAHITSKSRHYRTLVVVKPPKLKPPIRSSRIPRKLNKIFVHHNSEV